MNKFTESLYKLASELHSTGMEDRYSTSEDEEETFDDGTGAHKKYIKNLTPAKDPNIDINKATPTKVKGPKFFSAEPSSTKVNIKQLNDKKFSNENEFSSVAPYIIQAESKGKHYKSIKPNSNNTVDYGFFQINDVNLNRKTSGGKLADS
tara:strand:- start:1351 stop:1800 length:450 start_codon:yes stop_codon:yes gene_type:complete